MKKNMLVFSLMLLAVLTVGCASGNAAGSSMQENYAAAPGSIMPDDISDFISDEISRAMTFGSTSNGSGRSNYNASGEIVRVEVYTGDKQALLAEIEDKDALAPLNTTQTWSNSPENDIAMNKDEQTRLSAHVDGKEEYVFSLYQTAGAGTEWVADITTSEDGSTVKWSVSLGGAETFGLIADPFVFYQEAPDNLLEYLRSLI